MKNEYAITLTSENGAYFNIKADSFEISNDTYTNKPHIVMFRYNNDIICMLPYKDVYEIAQIKNDEYIKIEI